MIAMSIILPPFRLLVPFWLAILPGCIPVSTGFSGGAGNFSRSGDLYGPAITDDIMAVQHSAGQQETGEKNLMPGSGERIGSMPYLLDPAHQ